MECAYVSARFSWVFTFESKCSWVTLVSVSEYYISHESIASAEMQTRKYFTNIVTHCFFSRGSHLKGTNTQLTETLQRQYSCSQLGRVYILLWVHGFTLLANLINHVQSALSGVETWMTWEEREALRRTHEALGSQSMYLRSGLDVRTKLHIWWPKSTFAGKKLLIGVKIISA